MAVPSLCRLSFSIAYEKSNHAIKQLLKGFKGREKFNAAQRNFFEPRTITELFLNLVSDKNSLSLPYEKAVSSISDQDVLWIPCTGRDRVLVCLAVEFFLSDRGLRTDDENIRLILHNLPLPFFRNIENQMRNEDQLTWEGADINDDRLCSAENDVDFRAKLYPLFVQERERRSQIAIFS